MLVGLVEVTLIFILHLAVGDTVSGPVAEAGSLFKGFEVDEVAAAEASGGVTAGLVIYLGPDAAGGFGPCVPAAVAAAENGGVFVDTEELGDDVGALIVGDTGRVGAPYAGVGLVGRIGHGIGEAAVMGLCLGLGYPKEASEKGHADGDAIGSLLEIYAPGVFVEGVVDLVDAGEGVHDQGVSELGALHELLVEAEAAAGGIICGLGVAFLLHTAGVDYVQAGLSSSRIGSLAPLGVGWKEVGRVGVWYMASISLKELDALPLPSDTVPMYSRFSLSLT